MNEPDKRFEETWNEELKKKNPSFGRAMIKANWWWIIFHICGQGGIITCRMAQPILLGYFIDWFADPDSEFIPKFVDPETDGYILAALYSFVTFIYACVMSPYFHASMVQGHTLRMQACSLLYKKLMRLNLQGASQISIGKLVNLMGRLILDNCRESRQLHRESRQLSRV